MLTALGNRTLIIGNSGSGKTTLGAQLAALEGCPHIDLDTVYWAEQVSLKKRVQPEALAMVSAVAQSPAWVIEGVFGWLISEAAPRATTLIWLDLPWSDCKAGLEARGPAYSPSVAEYEALLIWAGDYWTRQSSSSHAGHQKIFDGFMGEKIVLRSRDEVGGRRLI